MRFEDIKTQYFQAFAEILHERYKKGKDIASSEVAEELKYVQPKKPRNPSYKPWKVMLLDSEADYNNIKSFLD